MPTGFPFVIPGLRTVLVADLFQGDLLINAPGGTNLYMDPASDATEEYYASTPCTCRIAAGRLLKKSASSVLTSFRPSTYPEGTPRAFTRCGPCWTPFLSSLRNRAHVALAVRTFDVRACQHSFSADCERSGIPWITPILLFLKQIEPKQPQRRLHRNLKVLGCHTGDRNHVVFIELADRWMDVKDHMDAHMVCEQRPSAN